MYVYFLRVKSRLKIGKSKDPLARMKSLQTGCPDEITLAGAIKCTDDSHAYRVEKQFHDYFSVKRQRGEWFQCTDYVISQVWDILSQIAAQSEGKVAALSKLDLDRIQSSKN